MVNRSKQLIPPIIGGISSFLPTKVSAFCFFSLIYTSCYYLPRTPKPVAITGFQNSDITSDNSKRHWIKTSLASRVSRVRTPDGVPDTETSGFIPGVFRCIPASAAVSTLAGFQTIQIRVVLTCRTDLKYNDFVWVVFEGSG